MLFKTIIMFHFFNDQFLHTLLYMYNITNVLRFIGLTLTFIGGILGIKACRIEIMKQC